MPIYINRHSGECQNPVKNNCALDAGLHQHDEWVYWDRPRLHTLLIFILVVGTLAANHASRYAETGLFDKAVELQASLVAKLEKNDPNQTDFSQRLEKYRNNEPWRE